MWLVNVHDVMSTKVVTHSVPPNWPVLVAARRGRDPGPRPELHLLPRPWRLLATTARRPRRRRSGRAAGGSRSCGPGALGPSSERGRFTLRARVVVCQPFTPHDHFFSAPATALPTTVLRAARVPGKRRRPRTSVLRPSLELSSLTPINSK